MSFEKPIVCLLAPSILLRMIFSSFFLLLFFCSKHLFFSGIGFPPVVWLHSQWAEHGLRKTFGRVSCLQLFIITFSCYFLYLAIAFTLHLPLCRGLCIVQHLMLFFLRGCICCLFCVPGPPLDVVPMTVSHILECKNVLSSDHSSCLFSPFMMHHERQEVKCSQVTEVKHKGFPKLNKSLIWKVGFITTSVINNVV